MTTPPVKFDWTINLGNVGAAIVFIVTGVLAYSDVKSDVRDQRTTAENKYREYDRLWGQQQKTDDEQNQRMLRIYDALTRQLAEARNDIRNDIRDLREHQVAARVTSPPWRDGKDINR